MRIVVAAVTRAEPSGPLPAAWHSYAPLQPR
jgi:hypothetical protein